ncbi:MAG: acyl carrier protein [Gemmatimonadales bacterium]|nr:acyl carrier protein [Gemmatimonadales bacterium]
MHDRDRIGRRVREVLAQVLDVPAKSIDQDFSATSSVAWTSLNHLMLISQLETEFDVVFSNQEIRELTSYTTIVDTLGRRLDSVA